MDILSSIGSSEIIVILLVALIAIGPGKIVQFSQNLGKVSRNLKKISSDLTTSVMREVERETNQGKAKQTSANPAKIQDTTSEDRTT